MKISSGRLGTWVFGGSRMHSVGRYLGDNIKLCSRLHTVFEGNSAR